MENDKSNGWNIAELTPQTPQDGLLTVDAMVAAKTDSAAPKHRRKTPMRIIASRAYRTMERIYVACPWIDRQRDRALLERWCILRIVMARLEHHILEHGALTTPEQNPKRIVSEHRMLLSTFLALSRELGLSPVGRQALKAASQNVAYDLAALCLEENEREFGPSPTDVEGRKRWLAERAQEKRHAETQRSDQLD
ncbi:MAG: P27 family phage terminase small subunit [Candidatus Binataceae bacterium]